MGKIVKLKNQDGTNIYPITKTEAVYVEDNKTTLKNYLDAMSITETAGPAQEITFNDGADNVPVKSLILNIQPYQEGTGDPSPTNIRPIIGHSGNIIISKTGKNLLPMPIIHKTYNIDTGQAETVQAATAASTEHIPFTFKHHENITVSYSVQLRTMMFAWDSNGDFVGRTSGASAPSQGTQKVRTFDKTSFNSGSGNNNYDDICQIAFRFYVSTDSISEITDQVLEEANLMIEYGTEATDYEEYNGQIYEIIIPNAAGTIYGGTIDPINGILTITHYVYQIQELTKWTSYNHTFYTKPLDGATIHSVKNPIGVICNCLPMRTGQAQELDSSTSFRATDRVYICVQEVTTAEEMQVWLQNHSVQVYLPLATPQIYSLTPTNITTVLGDNIIQMNTNGTIQITYKTDLATYISNAISSLSS